MGTNRLGQELVQCVNRVRPSSQEVVQVFGDVIQAKSILINDGLFSNYDLIEQNQLTSVIVSNHQEFTSTVYLNTVNNMHSTPDSKIYTGTIVGFPPNISIAISLYLSLCVALLGWMIKRNSWSFYPRLRKHSLLLPK